jgi:hypothetical protein
MAVSVKIVVSWDATPWFRGTCSSHYTALHPRSCNLNAFHHENHKITFRVMFWDYFLPIFRVTKSTILWIQHWEWLRGSHRWWTTISWRQSVILHLILYIQSEFKPSQVWGQALCLHLYLSKLSREVWFLPVAFSELAVKGCDSILLVWGNRSL